MSKEALTTKATELKSELNKLPKKLYIGKNKGDDIYITSPSWDCDWYWGFGYLSNKNTHYHIDGLKKHQTYNTEKKCFEYEFLNLVDGFKKHFGNTLIVRDSQLWKLCELFQTFYTLKESSEVLGRGGSYYTSNPCKNIITNTNEVNRINEIVLPSIFIEIYKILIPSQENEKINKELVKLNVKGDTNKVVNFMFEHNIHTDDLKQIEGLTSHDINIIHTLYWRIKHSNK